MKLIISVRNSAEALIAHACGADVVDLKEPLNGPLGQPDRPTTLDVLQRLPQETKLSMACGELVSDPGSGLESHRVNFAKAGCAGIDSIDSWTSKFTEFRDRLPMQTEAVAVGYADFEAASSPPAAAVLQAAGKAHAKRFLIDTYRKTEGSVFDLLGIDGISALLSAATLLGIQTALAGSIFPKDLPKLGFVVPDYIAMRGAVCETGRTSHLSGRRVRGARRAVDRLSRSRWQVRTRS